jgi:integrase/recombinase XerD
LVAFYEAIWQARQLTHVVMLKVLLLTGIRNAELTHLRLTDVDLHTCQLRITQGKGSKDRYVLFPMGFRGELAQYVERQQQQQGVLCTNPRTGALGMRPTLVTMSVML